MRPLFSAFRLVSISANGPKSKVDLAEHKVEINSSVSCALMAGGSQPEARPAALVKIEMAAIVQNKDEGEPPMADIKAHYEGFFAYPDDSKVNEIRPQFENAEYQRELISQTYPLAIAHIRGQMGFMGFSVRDLPLGLPDVGLVKV